MGHSLCRKKPKHDDGVNLKQFRVISDSTDERAKHVTIYDRWNLEGTREFIGKLKPYLKEDNIILTTENTYQQTFVAKKQPPLLVLCWHYSRIETDIRYSLEYIDSTKYKRLIVILLHWKKDDIERHAASQAADSSLMFIDAFVQKDKDNIKVAAKEIKKGIRDRTI
ncbi:uncharacterized protein LOC128552162 [Mercenaria mercenaria]|uniref:uncharacterized protein LOC128552162 n=1 Tax=Mercenaria mercenaria TaxID=6596 RepID=UPI00234F8F0B|nr:uncharacterized protein LOC128552162 [Mercenaria mercenaria]